MSDSKREKSSIVAQIVVAVVIALAVGGTAPWWWKVLFPEKSSAPQQPQATQQPQIAPQQSQPTSPLAQRQPTVEVERLVARWLDAWANGRGDDAVSLASEPFYFDQKVILTRQELRAAYERLRQEKGATWRELEIHSIKVQTARELQGTGYDLSKDRVFGSLNLTLDDYAAVVTVRSGGRSEGMLVAVRRIGDGYEIAGMWD